MPQPEQGPPTDAGTTGERRENHYVLLIHGTGAAPEKRDADEAADPPAEHETESAGGPARSSQASRGTPATADKSPPGGATEPEKVRKWYQSGDKENFCHRLDLELQRLGWAPSVWRTPEAFAPDCQVLEFSWSGANTHEARLAGGEKLDDLLRRIREADPRCRIHLVAHSHGGNVLLAGLDRYLGWMRHLAGRDAGGRSAQASTSAWARALDPEFHRLGRLVFLGTPFYYKCWLKGTSGLARFLDASGRWLRPLVFSLAFLYLLILAGAGLVSLLPWFGFVGWQPWQWHWTLLVGWLLPSFLAAQGASKDKLRRDVNLYFPGYLDVGDRLAREGDSRPLEALVVSAGFLDEALLVLSAQPLASAFLLPPMRQVLRPRWWRWLTPVAVGTRYEAPEQWGRFVKGIFLIVVNLITLPVTLLRRALSRPIGGWLAGKTRNALGSAAMGVPAWELEDARVEVRSSIDPLPGLLDPVTWDIERLLAKEEPPRPPHEPDRSYPFLWDEARLDEALDDSEVWERVKGELPAVLRRVGWLGEKEQEARIRRLQRVCLTLEARGRQILGSIELLHSAYYARPEFVSVIARFLALGEPPAETVAAERSEG